MTRRLWTTQTRATSADGPARRLETVIVLTTMEDCYYSQKELRNGVWVPGITISPNTMRKERKRWGLMPDHYDGSQPRFRKIDVERALEIKLDTLNKRFRVAA